MHGPEARKVASIAATGFGLSALCIADERRYLDRGVAQARVLTTLNYLASKATHEQGFFYHFLNASTGERAWQSEVSSVDTAWLVCGVLHASAHFDHPEIKRLAAEIAGRVDWKWMMNDGSTLAHGWRPESGFLPYRWDSYAELMAMYLIAMGSSTHPIPPAAWNAWQRPKRTFDNLTYIDAGAPLFAHQYSHAWFDFRERRDEHADYFENSRVATLAHRMYCRSLTGEYEWFTQELWGVTASDSRKGYKVWGGPSVSEKSDGTLVPCAAGGSVAFLPSECTGVLETMLARYGSKVWGPYGFVDAFHPKAEWYDPDVIGIDQGIMLLMAENLRSQSVWNAMMSTPEAERGLRAAGFLIAG